ncbi:MAG: DivIVA domain-containing protein [Clostridiales bacterium]|nr:DivIVA domain-containing protein [Clostridiales bacterium]
MITPLDIQEKEFPKGVRGYKEEAVDEFLDLITIDYEEVLRENEALKQELERLKADLTKYSSTENAVLETLEAAKSLMGDISSSAERRAEILLKNAELDAEIVLREAKEGVEKLNEENRNLNQRLEKFRTRYRNLLESELDRFETLSEELFKELAVSEIDFKDTESHDFKKKGTSSKEDDPIDMGKTLVIGSDV